MCKSRHHTTTTAMISYLIVSIIMTLSTVAAAGQLQIRGKSRIMEEISRPQRKCQVSDRNLLGLDYSGNYGLPKQALSAEVPAVIRILAIKVEFPEETPDDPQTTGNGRFDLRTLEQFEAEEGHAIDPAPHDNAYFQDHLKALASYWEVVSNGRLILEYEIFPKQADSAYQLTESMAHYGLQSPEFGLGEFVFDAITAADEDPGIDFFNEAAGEPNYQSFVIFHPGSDQQNNLPNFGQPTPADLFTGYVKLGAPFPVDEGTMMIQDAIVMPETASQDGRVTALNAVMAHEFSHQIGAVDLYDTRTFNTAVGDFSLLDNNGFGVNIDLGEESLVLVQGVMPVFPDAWHRAYWGFVDVVKIRISPFVEVEAAEYLAGETPQIVMVPINQDEYYLIENRRTDIDGDGVTNLQGDEETGVILWPRSAAAETNNREYDFLLPGSGMVIWHVDELAARLDYDGDGINNFDDNDLQWFNFPSDPRNWDNRHQFLALEEADGIIHFGREYFAGFGRPGDLFDINNNSEFGPTTNPPTESNVGAYTGISIDNISAAIPTMTCRIHTDATQLGWPNYVGKDALPLKVYDLDSDGSDEILTAERNFVIAYNHDGTSFFTPVPGTYEIIEREVLYNETQVMPETLAVFGRVSEGKRFILSLAVDDLDNDGFAEVVGGTNHMTVAAFNSRALSQQGEAVRRFETFLDEPIATAPIIADFDSEVDGKEILVYTMTSRRMLLDQNGNILSNETSVWPYRVMTDASGSFELVSPEDGLLSSIGSADRIRGAAAADFDKDATVETAEVYLDGTLRVNYSGSPLEINAGGPIFSEIAIGDIDANGQVDIAFGGDNVVYAYNFNGTPLANFPLVVNRAHPVGPLHAAPVLAQLDRDDDLEIIIGTNTGELTALNRDGSLIERFPRAAGGELTTPVVVGSRQNVDAVFCLSKAGEINSFLVSNLEPVWNSLYGSAQNLGSFVTPVGSPTLPAAAIGYVYNYPNPASEQTTIRFTVRESGNVKLKFYNTAGDIVLESEVESQAGIDNEVQVDCSQFASGVYFCQIETDSGERKHCSVAIIK